MKGGLNPLGVVVVALGTVLGVGVAITLARWNTPAETSSPPPTASVNTEQSKAAVLASTSSPLAEATPAPGPVSFRADILPLFQSSCVFCHGTMGGLTLTDYQSALKGGLHQPLVFPGAAGESLLYQRLVKAPYMPPTGPLPQQDIDKIKRWIDEGAQDK